jgi:hypothetical protein
MTITKRILKGFKVLSLSTAVLFGMIQCSEEQIITENSVSANAVASGGETDAIEVGSISVSGVYTEVAGDVECSTCTYIIDPSERTVDGLELGLKPGSIVCLNKKLSYPAIEFNNMEGSKENPIIIGYCAD